MFLKNWFRGWSAALGVASLLAGAFPARAAAPMVHTPLWQAGMGDVRGIAWTPDGTKVLVGGTNAALYDATTTDTRLFLFTGHTAAVTGVAVSPDGALGLTGSEDGTAKLWSLTSGALVRTFDADTSSVNAVMFSPDGAEVLTAGAEGKIRAWATATGALVRTWGDGPTSPVNALAFAPDAAWFASGSDSGDVTIWDPAATVPTKSLNEAYPRTHTAITALAVSTDSQKIAAGEIRGDFSVWDVSSGSVEWAAGSGYPLIRTIAFTPHGGGVLAVPAGSAGKVAVDGSFPPSPLPSLYEAAAFSPDGGRLTCLVGGALEIVDAVSGQSLVRLGGEPIAPVTSLAVSPDERRLVTTGGGVGMQDWQTSGGHRLHEVNKFWGPDGPAYLGRAIYLRDGSEVVAVSGHFDSHLFVFTGVSHWDGSTLAYKSGEVNMPAASVAASPTSTTLAFGALMDGEVSLRNPDAMSERILRTADWPYLLRQGAALDAVAYSPDGSRLLAGAWTGFQYERYLHDPTGPMQPGTPAKVALWDVPTGDLIRDWSPHLDGVFDVAWSPDGTWFATAGDEGTVKLWDATSLELIRTLQAPPATLDASITKITQWDTTWMPDASPSAVRSLAVSPDGRLILGGLQARQIVAWDVATGAEVQRFGDTGGAVVGMAFIEDGDALVSAGQDGALMLWDTSGLSAPPPPPVEPSGVTHGWTLYR